MKEGSRQLSGLDLACYAELQHAADQLFSHLDKRLEAQLVLFHSRGAGELPQVIAPGLPADLTSSLGGVALEPDFCSVLRRRVRQVGEPAGWTPMVQCRARDRIGAALLLKTRILERYPSLPEDLLLELGKAFPGSLVEGVAASFLTQALLIFQGCRTGERLVDQDSDVHLRSGGEALMSGPSIIAGEHVGGKSLYQRADLLSAIKLEGEELRARMVLRPLLASGAEPEDILAVYGLPHAHVSLPLAVRIDPPVALSCTRQSRKLLNIAGGDYSAVVAGGAIMGFAELTPEQQADPRTFTIVFRGQQHWSFLSGDRVLMDVQFGTPHLRKPLATEEEFVGRIRPLFPSISEAAIRRLHSLALEAGRMEHGTVLVVCANAAEEAQRLATQSTLIDPVQLTPRSFRSVSAIDGAVLTDFEGVCYAIGVILDGRAVHGQGDPSRGARYNSAVRYVGSNSSPTLAIVASVDGGIDLIAPETIEN